MKLPKGLDHAKKSLTNIHSTKDNEYFKWYLVKYLHPADHDSGVIKKIDRLFEDYIDFDDIKFPAKIKGINKIEKKNCFGINTFDYKEGK